MELISGENSEKKRKGNIQILCNLFVHTVTELEKTIVQWTPDKEVQFCRWCSKSFNVRRRRHHCRLCGSIMCKKCSIFLLFSEARECHNPYLHNCFMHMYTQASLFMTLAGGIHCLLHHPRKKENCRRILIQTKMNAKEYDYVKHVIN